MVVKQIFMYFCQFYSSVYSRYDDQQYIVVCNNNNTSTAVPSDFYEHALSRVMMCEYLTFYNCVYKVLVGCHLVK